MSRRSRQGQGRVRASIVLSGLALWLVGSPLLAQSSLKARRDFAVGDHPVGLIVADFDNDGSLDLLSVDQLSGNLSLVKGFGDGTFRRIATIVAGGQPSGAVYLDVNADGKPDIVASNQLTRDVTVNLGDGTGDFAPKISSSVSGNPVAIAAGDWNGDGKIDVATVTPLQTTMSILLGNGDGTFTLKGTPFTIGSGPRKVVAGDFSLPAVTTPPLPVGKDGRLDLAVVNGTASTIQIWRGDGTGQFILSRTLATDLSPQSMVAADFNGDGNLDIAEANSTGESVEVFLGAGNGTFGTPTRITPGFGPLGLAASDINKDGKLDLLVTLTEASGSGQLAEALGDGTGAFTVSATFNVGATPRAVVAGDFNKDGNLDVATANNTGNNLSILQSVGAGAFLVAGKIVLPSGSFPAAVAVGDFNLDGKPDVVVADQFTNNVISAFGDCLGGFTPAGAANNVGITPVTLAVADFNGDGDPDLVTANNSDNTISLLQNSGSGNFTVTNGILLGTVCDSPVAIATGEFSGDQHPDVAVVCEAVGYMCNYIGTGGSGAAAFGPPVCTQLGGTSEGIALGRYNLDALDDAAVSARDLNVAQVAIANGSGGVVDIPGNFPVGAQPIGVARGDLNGDGFRDIVVANSGAGTISALLGDGGGAFSFPSLDTPAGQAPSSLVIQDFNMDGLKDVAVVNSNANNVSLLLGDGAGHFSNAGDFGVRDAPQSIAAGDFNCDGKPDLAVADNLSDTVTILLNQSIPGDPLQISSVLGGSRLTFRWGLVPGAIYDVIRGQVKSVNKTTNPIGLGAVTCLANDLAATDTGAAPDASIPPPGDAYFYTVRAIVNGVPGQYTVSSPGGIPGVPSSGACP